MAKRPKPKWRKITSGDFASCWFCGYDTYSSLSFSNGDEVMKVDTGFGVSIEIFKQPERTLTTITNDLAKVEKVE